MNDEQLMTALRARLADVHMGMPLEAIERRGRRRQRHRITATAAATTGLAGTAAAFAVPGLFSHGSATAAPTTAAPTLITTPMRTPNATLAAWTVATGADGTVQVTIRQLSDPAGLQAQLRADGIPANVSFDPDWSIARFPAPAGCQRVDGSAYVVVAPGGTADDTVVFTIDPAAIPDGDGVALQAGLDPTDMLTGYQSLVQASPDCTGS
jgi:hypothetical protein